MSTRDKDDIVVATAALLGGHPIYFDYGHPERASSRKYWTLYGGGDRVHYGSSRADCARAWLRATHPEVKLK